MSDLTHWMDFFASYGLELRRCDWGDSELLRPGERAYELTGDAPLFDSNLAMNRFWFTALGRFMGVEINGG